MTNIVLENDRLIVSGDLDFASVVTIWNASLPLIKSCKTLQFDFGKVTSVKSAAIALVVAWIKLAKCNNKPISLNHLPEQLMSIANVCSVHALLDAYSS